MDLIWVCGEAESFCIQDWTGQISLIRHDKSDFRRMSMEPFSTVFLAAPSC
jgi:hypothetical protein